MSSQMWWYLTRASGIVAWLMLVAGFLWGVLLVSRLLGPSPRPAWMLDLHRWLGGLAVVFTGVHLASLVADSYVHFDLVDLLVPYASDWRAGAVAWGVVALWILLAVEITSLMMRRLPRKAWRWVHLSSYALLWTATIHGVVAGTDARNPIVRAVLVAIVTVAVIVVGHRVVRGSAKDRRAVATRRPPERQGQAVGAGSR